MPPYLEHNQEDGEWIPPSSMHNPLINCSSLPGGILREFFVAGISATGTGVSVTILEGFVAIVNAFTSGALLVMDGVTRIAGKIVEVEVLDNKIRPTII